MSRSEEFGKGIRPATELPMPDLGWKPDSEGEERLVNMRRHPHRGPVMSEDEAKAKGWEGPVGRIKVPKKKT